MVLSIKHASEVCWIEVCKKVKDAIIFIDDFSGECLHWHGGLLRLLQSGATSVKQFSSFENGEDHKKAVFIVSSPLVGPARIILRDLISNSKFLHCVLITSCSPIVLTVATTGNVPESSNEMSALKKLELDMLRWMKSQESTAEIFHFPISVVPLTDYFFATPPFSNMFPCFTEDLQGKTLYSQMPRNLDLEALPLELQIGVMHIMTTINSLLSHISVQEEIFCIGLFSSLIGSQLQKYSSSALRAKMAANKMSLLLIDRTLDLCSVMYSGKDVLLDKMKSVLPAFPGHSVDVAIDVSPVCYAKNEPNDYTFIAPGCLHEPPSNIFELLINKNVKDIVLELYKRLAKASNISKIPPSVTMTELESLILKNFQKNYEKIQASSETIQASLGMIETLKSPKISSLEMAECSQKMLLQSVAAEGNTDEAVKQLQELVLNRNRRGFSIEIILTIITFFYSLIGQKFSVNPQLEKELKKAIADALLEDKEELGMPKTFLENVTKSNIKEFCEHIFTKLQYLKNARMHLTKYSDIVRYEGPVQPLEYNGLITQLICDIVDVTKPDIPDLRYKANYGLRDNFTSRFSKILNVSKPHVMDNEYIMVYVVGGITAQEVKFIKDCFKAYGKDVIIGSTSLVSELQVLRNLFINDPLKPFVI
uniref:Putative sec1 family domain protein n=1 Tax=Panstrongylus megistus TaxID=65343 RepID=A0A069DZE7_9HEMI